ncbi:MAG: hypothetical protein M1839_002922 [Geoglossum umbratile]|nr:MAG: hypothetical protein M1839_002922 [Geoglossum umbratile]
MSGRGDRRRSRSPRRRSPAEDDARYRRRRDDGSQRDPPRRGEEHRGGGRFKWKARRRKDDRDTGSGRDTWRNDRSNHDVNRRRDVRDGYDREDDRDAGRRRRSSRSPKDKDAATPAAEKRVDKPDKPEKPSKQKKTAVSQEPMIIVHVNDRLGTKAAIPCLASDPVKLFKAQVAARVGREPHEIMLKRQGEKPFRDELTLEDYSVSNGVQLDLSRYGRLACGEIPLAFDIPVELPRRHERLGPEICRALYSYLSVVEKGKLTESIMSNEPSAVAFWLVTFAILYSAVTVTLPKGTFISEYRLLTVGGSLPFTSGTTHQYSSENATKPSKTDSNAGFKNANKKTKPSFHLLIPASETNPNLCKTLLSAFILNYPPPTLINFNKTFDGNNWDKGSRTGKIRGVWDHLAKMEHNKDEDLVLVIDGYDVWFQLPPEVMIERYYRAIRDANKWLKSRYGMVTSGRERFTEAVVYAADKLCWPNLKEGPACRSIPESTLPENAWGPGTDEGRLNRPRFLNSGNVIGPVAAMKAVYGAAVMKVEDRGRGTVGDQFVFSEIFGEQQYQREVVRQANRRTSDRLQEWLAHKLGLGKAPKSDGVKANDMVVVEGQGYEFGIGLDYEAAMFQTMAHSHDDVEYLIYNNTACLPAVLEETPTANQHVRTLPDDILSLRPPFPTAQETFETNTTTPLPPLPPLPNLTWTDLPLATNLYTPSIPALLHFNGAKSYLRDWWPRMWYHEHARALLQSYMRSAEGPAAARAAGAGGHTWWDLRGGKGGAWTDRGVWMAWRDICGGFEEEVFGDGGGRWGGEEGEGRVYNSWGKLVAGGD